MSTFPAEIDAALDRTLVDTIEPDDVNELDARTRALEAKVGIDDSPVVTSHDHRIRALETEVSSFAEGLPRTEVTLASVHTVDGGEGGPWYTVGSWRYVASEWPSCAFALRIEGLVTTDGLTATVRLVRADTNALAHVGNLEIDSPDVVHVARDLTLADGVIYLLQARFDVPGGDSFTLFSGRIHIVRS